MVLFVRLVALVCYIFAQICDGACVQCMDEAGNAVDWLFMYKLPKESNSTPSGDSVHEGIGYTYITSDNLNKGWIVSNKSVDDPTSIPARTFAPLYGKGADSLMYILYNDEHPDGNTSMTAGHTKGVVVFDKNKGFWMVHSVPKFPPSPGNGTYDYPTSGERNGQSFLCISLKTSESAEKVANQLLFNRPFIYATNIPDWAKGTYDVFKNASEEGHVQIPPFFSTLPIKSLSGVTFTSFAKYTKFQKDLYADLVAPSFQQNLMVETWPNGPGKMNSSCDTPFKVQNVDEINFGKWIDAFDFKTQRDHSKWAISYQVTGSKLAKVVCVGDINRMTTQMKRAGGTVCLENEQVWKAYSSLVKNVEPCNRS